jgi:hypothetical protein
VRDPYWFVKPRTLLLIVNEYHKYLVAFARSLPEEVQRWSWGRSSARPSP